MNQIGEISSAAKSIESQNKSQQTYSSNYYKSLVISPPEPEPLALAWIIVATTIIAIVGAALLVYFRKTRKLF